VSVLTSPSLNLTRKWRVQSFDAIIGQPMIVRMLKNSLYAQHYFPVYLFFGQHGCGKTSTARIFAMAVNCASLADFQKNPKNTPLPCKQCQSCVAMAEGNHPDFTEIDAASYTGVDHVRQIIEASSFMPILGHKKIYLIDEAHMLSKSAFNALLKILEEPPKSVFFMLATTDSEKIIETVKSRCFQLFFNPVRVDDLQKYLTHMCVQESISFTPEGMIIVAQQAKGSVRDGLNIIERVRFAYDCIDAQTVYKVLGQVSDQLLLQLIDICWFGNNLSELMALMQEERVLHASPEYMWQRLQELLRYMLWFKYGVTISYVGNTSALHDMTHKASLIQIHSTIERLYKQEPTFLKTLSQRLFLELVLSDIMHQNMHPTTSLPPESTLKSLPQPVVQITPLAPQTKLESNNEKTIVTASEKITTKGDSWSLFITRIQELGEPLLLSIFQQARVDVSRTNEGTQVTLILGKDKSFLNDLINDNRPSWKKIFNEIFGVATTCHIEYTADEAPPSPLPSSSEYKKEHASAFVGATPSYRNKGTGTLSVPHAIDVSDSKKWPVVTMILEQFPGAVVRADL
jgi:DNA polymerase III subunit gamma/tau